MSRIIVFVLIFYTVLVAQEIAKTPESPSAVEGKSVYVPPVASVDVVEEGCVQKEDQNITKLGGAK
ncbi:MAG: hypothetical protein V2A75_11250 [Pseudomonadota bacterium]